MSAHRFREAWQSNPGPWPGTYGELLAPVGFDDLAHAVRQTASTVEFDGSGWLGMEVRSHEDLARTVLLSAVLTTPPATVDLLRRWISGEPVRSTRVTVFDGFTLQEPAIELARGFVFKHLPNNPMELLQLGAPPSMMGGWPFSHASPGSDTVSGKPAMFVDMEMAAFGGSGNIFPEHVPADPDPSHVFTQSLSLALDHPVNPICAWTYHDDTTRSFRPWVPEGVSFWNRDALGSSNAPVAADRTTLNHAADIGRMYAAADDPSPFRPIHTAIDRWIESKAARRDAGFVDLRIAFESVYADGGSGEIALQVATRCARHLADDLADRRVVFKDVKKFYGTASGYVHGRAKLYTKAEKDRAIKAQADDLFRQALLKIVHDGKMPNLEQLLLGP
ncbi:MAG: hypothetical protein OXQ89_21155 [Rhodospirillaceae bacterium]|nr:hypothetical protein [Rhodospirillaceae bacterium]